MCTRWNAIIGVNLSTQADEGGDDFHELYPIVTAGEYEASRAPQVCGLSLTVSVSFLTTGWLLFCRKPDCEIKAALMAGDDHQARHTHAWPRDGS